MLHLAREKKGISNPLFCSFITIPQVPLESLRKVCQAQELLFGLSRSKAEGREALYKYQCKIFSCDDGDDQQMLRKLAAAKDT